MRKSDVKIQVHLLTDHQTFLRWS